MLPLSFVGAPLEMTKRRWKESMQVLFDKHFGPTKDEELKQSKRDIESKLPKIVKLVKERRLNKRNRNTEFLLRKETELIELIEDFYKQYQFVYDLYDHLRGQLSQTVNGIKEDEDYFTATSNSDTESEKDISNRENNQEHGALKQNLAHLAEEKECLNSEYMYVTKKVKESEKILLRLEAESRQLRKRLAEKEQQLSSLAQMHKHRQREASTLIKELELELSSLNLELGCICTRKPGLGDEVENKTLQDHASTLQKIEKDMDGKLSPLVNGVERVENGTVQEGSEIMALVAQVNNMKFNVKCLSAQKGDLTSHENLSDQVNKMKHDLGSMRKKNAELESNIKKKAQENSNILNQIEDLKKILASKDVDIQRMKKGKDDALLRAQILESNLHDLCNLRSEIEKQNHRLKQEVEQLQGKMLKRDKSLKQREDQFSTLQKQLEDREEDKPAQIVALTTQINHLEQKLEFKNDLESHIKIKNQDIDKLIEEKELLQGRILELEKILEDRHDEFTNLQNKMSTQIVALTREVSRLQQETYLKRKLHDQISSQEMEINELGEQQESLQGKLLELEINLTEKEDQIAVLQRRLQIGENEKAGLSAQIDYLEKELSSEKQEFLEGLTKLENQNNELSIKISEQQLMLKQQDDAMNKLKQDCKLVKGRFLQAADRKMDEVAEEFRKYFEDNLRILSRRIRVAEQLHTENKDSFKRLKDQCEQEHPGLERKIGELMSARKADLEKISNAVNEIMKAMESVIDNYESKQESFLKKLSSVSDDIQLTKNWVRWTMDEMKPWKNESGASLVVSMDDNERDKVMEEKVRRLEAKVKKTMGDKLRLMRGMYELQKKVGELEKAVVEKDEGLLRMREEKVEAIRQLCLWIDYHQSRFDDVKDRELEVGTLNDHKDELEEQTRMSKNEAIQLREEIRRLQGRVLELETAVQEGEEKVSTLHRKLDNRENEASLEIMALITEISNLKEVLQTVQTVKGQLEAQIEKEKQETYQHLSWLENENAALRGKSNNQLKKLKELQEAVEQKKEQCEQLKYQLQEREVDLQAAERKIEKQTEDLSIIAVLKRQIEDLKIDLKTAKDEANAAEENTHTIELELHLANQKLQITEQLLNEKGEDRKREEQKFKEECELLQDTISGLKHTLASNNKAYCKMIIDISNNVNNLFAEMERVTRKFNEDQEKFSSRIFKIASEIQIVKQQAGAKNTEKEQLKEELSNITEQLQNEREQGLVLKEEICRLGEEKREAIRQLCLWCDNLQSHYDELKSIVSKSTSQRRQNR
ncbi:hypothetical protein Cgig2_031518 [Carnegiea gigantea]|uniref:NAB domain-containing protein n=1 Tax=Carnegiea gigantea TaxID=171969 RepID=A0A9Q1K562_9CARY|nr:hypothetical protein Cgig2_031518 [Carnegiea gigantea]